MRAFLCLTAGGLLAAPIAAQQPDVATSSMEEVVVTGEFPGPGMWKVTRPDDSSGHALWIVGDPWPLPKGWKWKSKDVEAKAASAQEILWDASFNLTTDEKVGLLRGMTLLPAVLKARRNPDGAKLADVLPSDLYARWQVQKKLYLGRERGVESWRPLFAADKLREAAFEELGMTGGGSVSAAVANLAKKSKIKMTSPQLKFTFKRSEIRSRIKEFARESLGDEECFRITLDLTEALARRDVENARARAWATGDLAGHAALPPLPNPNLACTMAIMDAEVARDLVPADIREQLMTKWLDAANASLAANQTTFAVVPFGKLTRPNGYLDRLKAKGYSIESPQ